jgi:ribosomal protein S18 acetylase RimI-like enzyme
MEVRPFTFDDREKISRLLRQRGIFNEREVQVALDIIDETLLRPERKAYFIFCAVDDSDSLAGYICFGPIPMTEASYDLYWIVVDEGLSRRGVGRELLGFMEGFVKKEGARRIYVETSSNPPYEPARSFYEKHGYQVVCTLRDFYREGEHRIVFMKDVRCLGLEKGRLPSSEKDNERHFICNHL